MIQTSTVSQINRRPQAPGFWLEAQPSISAIPPPTETFHFLRRHTIDTPRGFCKERLELIVTWTTVRRDLPLSVESLLCWLRGLAGNGDARNRSLAIDTTPRLGHEHSDESLPTYEEVALRGPPEP